jgi:hypothetical protein
MGSLGYGCGILGGSPLIDNYNVYLCVYRLYGNDTYVLRTVINVGHPSSDPELTDAIGASLRDVYGMAWEHVFANEHLYFSVMGGESILTSLGENEYTYSHMFNNISSYIKTWE